MIAFTEDATVKGAPKAGTISLYHYFLMLNIPRNAAETHVPAAGHPVRRAVERQLAVEDARVTAYEHSKRAGLIGAVRGAGRDLSWPDSDQYRPDREAGAMVRELNGYALDKQSSGESGFGTDRLF